MNLATGDRLADLGFDDVHGMGVKFPSFRAQSREEVDAFVEAARAEGVEILHEPRVWPEYHPGYYGGFVRDLDGNNIEAVHHTF